jgi:hypothetical protein
MEMAAALTVAVVLAVLLVLAARAADALGEILAGIRLELEKLVAGAEAPQSHRIADLEHAIELLPKRWEEFAYAASRAEARARAVVRDARKELAASGIEHAGVEAQAGQLRLVDEEGSGGEAVPPVRESMEGTRGAPPDWKVAGLKRKFGGG